MICGPHECNSEDHVDVGAGRLLQTMHGSADWGAGIVFVSQGAQKC